MTIEQISLITLLMGVVVVIAIYLVTTLRLELRRKTGEYEGLKTIIRNTDKEKNTQDLQRQFIPCKDIEYVLHILDRRIEEDIKDIYFKLPETYTTHMMYLAVMELIKAERLYHLCPYVKKMITPKGLRGRTYKIWIEEVNI